MKNWSKVSDNDDGFIHHLGIILIAIVLVGAVGFAVYRIQNRDVNYGYNDSTQDDEDQTQASLDSAEDQSSQASDDSDQDVTQVTSLTEENDSAN